MDIDRLLGGVGDADGPALGAGAEQYIGRPPAFTALGETIIQVLAHAVRHRAQANAPLRTLGAEPPIVDYIAWLWLERPAAVWPAITSV